MNFVFRGKPQGLLGFLLAVGIGLTTQCAPDEICFSEQTTVVHIEFEKELYAGTDSAEVQSDTLIFNRVGALGTDSVFIAFDTLTEITLPVNTAAEATVFTFDTDQGLDTLELFYRRQQRLISVDCGPELVIDNLLPGRFSFDSVVIVSPFLNEQITTNVEIYR